MKNRGYKILFEYIEITLGCALVAVGLVLFLVPNTIAPGGSNRISCCCTKGISYTGRCN